METETETETEIEIEIEIELETVNMLLDLDLNTIFKLFTTRFSDDGLTIFELSVVFGIDFIVLIHYIVHWELFTSNNKKYLKSSTLRRYLFLSHAFSGTFEIIFGYLALISLNVIHILKLNGNHDDASFFNNIFFVLTWLAFICAAIIHIPTSLYLSPFVWGIKYLTVSGYVIAAFLRGIKAYNLWISLNFANNINVNRNINDIGKNLQDLWILIHMAIVVRYCAAYVFPFTRKNGTYGDLSTHPIYYTLSVAVASSIVVSIVFPPYYNLLFLVGFSILKIVFRSHELDKQLVDVQKFFKIKFA